MLFFICSLKREQAIVYVHDPFIEEYNVDLNHLIKDANILILAVNHEDYKNLDIDQLKNRLSEDCIICDIWNMQKSGKIICN